MVSGNLSSEKLCLSLDVLFNVNQKLFQLVFSLKSLHLKLLALFRLYFVVVHGLVDMAEVVAKIFFMTKLKVDFFKALIQSDKIIDIVDFLPKPGRFLVEPNVEGVSMFFNIEGDFLFESFRQVFDELNCLAFHLIEGYVKDSQVNGVGDFLLELIDVL